MSGAAIRVGKTYSKVADSFGSYKSEKELRQLVVGKKYDILWNDNKNYIGLLEEFNAETLVGKIHLIGWSGYVFEGSFTKIYIANEKQFSTVDGRNRHFNSRSTGCVVPAKKVERGRSSELQVYHSGDLGPGYKQRERRNLSSPENLLTINNELDCCYKSNLCHTAKSLNKKRKNQQSSEHSETDPDIRLHTSTMYSSAFESTDYVPSVILPSTDLCGLNAGIMSNYSKTDLRNQQKMNPTNSSLIVEKSPISNDSFPKFMVFEKRLKPVNNWLTHKDFESDFDNAGFDDGMLSSEAMQPKWQNRSSFSPPPSETSTFKTYQNVNYDVTQCHTDEIVVFPKYSSQINTLKVAGNSTEDRPSDVLVSVSNGQQVTDNSKPHQENKMEIANANQIVTADMYMPGFQAIKSFLSANLNKYVGLENVSIRFSGERGEVPEYVREDCPVNGIQRTVSISHRFSGKPVNKMSYLTATNVVISDAASAKDFWTKTRKDPQFKNVVFPFVRVDCFCQLKNDECFLHLKCVVGKSGCNQLIHADCVDESDIPLYAEFKAHRFICPMCVIYLEGMGMIDQYGTEFTRLKFRQYVRTKPTMIKNCSSTENSLHIDSNPLFVAALSLSMLANHTEQFVPVLLSNPHISLNVESSLESQLLNIGTSTLGVGIVVGDHPSVAPDPVVIEKFGFQLRKSHLKSLEPSTGVHPRVVEFMMSLLQERDCLDRGNFLPSKFCHLVTVNSTDDLGDEKVIDKLTKASMEPNLDTLELFLIPFYFIASCKYCLVVVDCAENIVRFYDSGPEAKHEVSAILDCVLAALKHSRGDEKYDKDYLNCGTTTCDALNSGVFVLMCAIVLSAGEGLREGAIPGMWDMFRQKIHKSVLKLLSCVAPCGDKLCPFYTGGRHSFYPCLAPHPKNEV